MSSQNKIIVIGSPVEDPDVKVSTNGQNVANFKFAVDRPVGQSGQTVQDIIPVVAWRENAELLETCKKGNMLLIEGRIQTRTYDTNEGVRKYVTEIDARIIKKLEGQAAIPETAFSEPTEHQAPQYDFVGQPEAKEPVAEPQENLPEDLPNSLEEKPVEATTSAENFDFKDPFTTNTETNDPEPTDNIPF